VTAVRDGDSDAFSALASAAEGAAAALAGEWIRVTAMAKIAVEEPDISWMAEEDET
jgi:hypothetical protein